MKIQKLMNIKWDILKNHLERWALWCRVRDIKNPHQIVATANNRIRVMSDTSFHYCKNEKKKPKEDATYVFTQDM